MMAQPSDAPLFIPVSVIGPQFVLPYQLEVMVDRYSSGNFVITDTNQKIMLKVKPYNRSNHRQLLLLDADDRPVAMLREKMHEMQPTDNVKFSKNKFMVTIYPNVDYAFVVTLIAIVDAMERSDTSGATIEVVGGVTDLVGAMGGALAS
ncbi:hypothetical protein OSB04_020245 [Centaurea solstitialis]|uniref:Uncharacterized protein n=1 Tax=Centaurea solstitialis TaxID=347529 RepID=A0AA38W3P1_9ASTR|nr:hypothetical protein OSB04_020245 [Centaurea solstitialis]